MAERGWADQTDRAAWEGEMFRLLAENVKDYAIFVVDPNRHILSWSQGAERLLGFTEQEILGRQCDCFFTPEDVQQGVPQRELEQALATGRGDDDRWHQRKDGTRFWASGAVTPLKDESGRLRGFAKIMRDRTELKRAEDELAASRGRLQALFDNTLDAVLLADNQGRYVDANPAACTLLGYSRDELVGLGVLDLTPAPDANVGQAAWAAFLRDGRQEGEYTIRRKDDTQRVVEYRAVANIQPGLHLSVLRDVTRRQRTEAALRESQARLAAVFEALPVGVGVTDATGTLVLSNQEMHRYLPTGVLPSRDDDRHRRWVARWPDGRPVERADFPSARALKGERVVPGVEMLYTHDNGTEVWTQVAAVPIRDGEGHVTGQVAVVNDIDALKRAEQALRESEVRLRAILESLPVGVLVAEAPSGRLVLANRQVEDTLTYPFREAGRVEGHAGYRAFRPDGRPLEPHEWPLARSVTSGELVTGEEIAFERGDGTRRVMWVSSAPIRDAAGGITAAVVIFSDVTEQRRAEERFRAFLNHSPGALFVKDAGGRYTLASRGFEAALGRSATDILGKTDDDLFSADPARLFQDEDRRVRAEGRPRTFEETFDFGGRRSTFLSVKFPLPDGSVGCVTADITDRKAMEEALVQADRRKDEFLATLAHELRNPLAPLRNGLEVMKLARGNPAAIEQAQRMMERQLGQMVRLIDDLLDMSRITQGKLQLRRERVELASVVQSAVEGSRPLIEGSGHRLIVALPQEPVHLDADPTRLAQVFANLLTNAAKYTEKGGNIWLTAGLHGGEVAISVRDTGIGIAPDHLPRLFEMFLQVDSALERSQGGLGIGLSLVKGLTEMHGGTVEARSEGPGKGSEFLVRLPVGPGTTVPETRDAGREAGPARRGRRILVADDNRDAADSLAMMLRLQGHEVHAAHDGQEAVEAAGWFRPDVALLDIGMPRLNGYEVAQHIRGQPWAGTVVLVAVTGWGQEEDRRMAAESGFDHHLTKPVDPAALEELLGDLGEE